MSHAILAFQLRVSETRLKLSVSRFGRGATKARTHPEATQRLTRFVSFYTAPSSHTMLRKAALCLQLAQHALRISSKKHLAEAPEVPVLVQLGRGVVQSRTGVHLYKLIRLLPADQSLDVLDVLEGLFTTEIHIIIRYDQYSKYPTKMWEISRQFNPHHYATACQDLVETNDDELDFGYALLLKHDALSRGDIGSAVTYLTCPTVQEEVDCILRNGKAHSLDVERKNKQDKSSESQRVVSISHASRNSILQRYRLQRAKVVEATIQDRRRAKKDLYINTRALAIAEQPHLFTRGTGQLLWQGRKSKEERQGITHQGDETTLQAYIRQHSDRLNSIMRTRQQRAKEILQRSSGVMPFTNAEWLTWMREHLSGSDRCDRCVIGGVIALIAMRGDRGVIARSK